MARIEASREWREEYSERRARQGQTREGEGQKKEGKRERDKRERAKRASGERQEEYGKARINAKENGETEKERETEWEPRENGRTS